jgi:hypothetical protein
MKLRFTKTFVENRYYVKAPGAQPGQWQELPRAQTQEVPIDDQIANWVKESGHLLVHPGQLGIHTSWHDTHMSFKCITLGLTVLYELAESGNGEQEPAATDGGPDTPNSTVPG